MIDFFRNDPNFSGAKGAVFIGDKLLVSRRDDKTDDYPLFLDFPGGGAQSGETPFQTFQREAREEFGIAIEQKDIVYWRRYPKINEWENFVYFSVAKLPASAANEISFGDEGSGWQLMKAEKFINNEKAVPYLRSRLKEYLETSNI